MVASRWTSDHRSREVENLSRNRRKANEYAVQNSVRAYVDLHKIALLRCRSLKQVTGGPSPEGHPIHRTPSGSGFYTGRTLWQLD